MRSVIFLDIDGVLNCQGTRDKCCGYRGIEDKKVALLKQIVDDMGGAELILSSTWRGEYESGPNGGSTKMGRYLKKKLAKQELVIKEKTPFFGHMLRGKEVYEWLKKNQDVERFLILDDEDFEWQKWDLDLWWYCTQDPDDFWCGPGLTEEAVEYIHNHINDYLWLE